jgi:hypothetical protein
MTMCDCATFDVDDIRVQTQVFRDRNCDRREGLVDLYPLYVSALPTGTVENLSHRRHWTQAEHAWLDGARHSTHAGTPPIAADKQQFGELCPRIDDEARACRQNGFPPRLSPLA